MTKQCCGTCKYCERNKLGDYICCNIRSDNAADYVEYSDTCEEWEERK